MPQTIHPEQAPEPLICGKYRIEHEIGRGGMGVVYRAWHVGLECPVALKIVLPELAQNDVVVRRMLDEARCAAQITSAHVVRVMDLGQLESGQPFIVMELVAGEDLARVVERDGQPSRELAVQWVLEAAVAIAEAHEKGIVHRDLKPENIFLARSEGADPVVKVLDFGISKRLDRSVRRSVTRAHELIGSPHYMAPEQIRAPLSVDARADIWSLGVILIELLTGQRAFVGDTLSSVCASVLESEPDLPEAVLAALPPALVVALRRALQKDPDDRFQSVAELAAALAPFAPPRAEPSLQAIARRSRGSSAQGGFPRSDCNVALPSVGPSPRQATRWRSPTFWALGLVIGALGIERWIDTHRGVSTADPHVPLAPSVAVAPNASVAPSASVAAQPLAEPALAAPVVEPSAPAPPLPLPEPEPSMSSQASPRPLDRGFQHAAPPPPAGASLPSAARARARTRTTANDPPRRSAPVVAGNDRGTSSAPAKNAWDLETFGGRR